MNRWLAKHRSRCGFRHRCSGFTLVELSITMTAGSAIMVLAIGMVHQAMLVSSASRTHADQARSLNRLAADFRRDVHEAERCEVESSQQIILMMPDETAVTYVAKANLVTRSETRSEKRLRQDSYEVFASSLAVFESIDHPDRAVLTIVRPMRNPLAGDQSRVDRQVAAVLGRRRMHEQPETSP